MAIKTFAPGNAPATGNPGFTPAPKKTFVPGPDVTGQPRKGGDGYGQASGPANPSSVKPGTAVSSAMAKSLAAAQDDGEHVLDTLQTRGARMDDPDFQTRVVSDQGFPPAHGMKNPNSKPGVIPAGNSFGGNNSAFGAELAAKQHGKK
jgi:hypothetical protein